MSEINILWSFCAAHESCHVHLQQLIPPFIAGITVAFVSRIRYFYALIKDNANPNWKRKHCNHCKGKCKND